MSLEAFEEECDGCKPALLDAKTMQPYPPESPEMKAVMAVWEKTTKEERVAWHAVTCQNSRSPADVIPAGAVARRIEEALKTVVDEKERN